MILGGQEADTAPDTIPTCRKKPSPKMKSAISYPTQPPKNTTNTIRNLK
jgi:hypothetical protein